MSLSSGHLDAFMAVAELLNFTKAAEKLHVTQSALSQRILNLEDELKTTLFIRDRAGLKLTEQAFDLVRYCQTRNLLEDEFLEGIKSQNSNELAGIIKIGGFSSIMRSVALPSMGPLLAEHKKLKLIFTTKEMVELPDALKRGEIDYMILDNRLDRDELEKVHLGYEHYVLVQAKKYSGPEIFLDHEPGDTTTESYLKIAKRKLKKLERRYLDDIYALIDGVSNSIGVAVLPIHLVASCRDLEIINPDTILKVPVFLYFYKKAFYSKLHDIFLDHLVKNSQKILEGFRK